MSISSERFIKLWENRIKKGRNFFIVKFAIIWGVSMILFVPLFNLIFDGKLTVDNFINEFKSVEVLIRFVVFILAGVILGFINWKQGIKRYNQIKAFNQE
jgi:hypothetical protein